MARQNVQSKAREEVQDSEPAVVAEKSIPLNLKDPASSSTTLEDPLASLAEIVISAGIDSSLRPNSYQGDNQSFIMPFSDNENDFGSFTSDIDSVHSFYQLADCFATIGQSSDAFQLYQRSMHETLRIRAQQSSISDETVVQYLLWGIIGCCTACHEDSQIEFTTLCLTHAADSLPQHSSSDFGTRAILRAYQEVLEDRSWETASFTHLPDFDSWDDLFHSLHPAIRLREAHFLLSITTDQKEASVPPYYLPESGKTAIDRDIAQLLREHRLEGPFRPSILIEENRAFIGTAIRPGLIDDQIPAILWEKVLFWVFIRHSGLFSRNQMQGFLFPHFLSQFAKLPVDSGTPKNSAGQGNITWPEEHVITFESIPQPRVAVYPMYEYLAGLRGLGALQKEADTGIYDDVNYSLASQLLKESFPERSHQWDSIRLPILEKMEQKRRRRMEHWERRPDIPLESTEIRSFQSKSLSITLTGCPGMIIILYNTLGSRTNGNIPVSTDTRSLLSPAGSINHILATGKNDGFSVLSSTRKTRYRIVIAKNDPISDTTSISTNDNASVSTDTRSFLSTARRIKHNLDLAIGKNDPFSDTMSIDTNESWKFHRVTSFPDDGEPLDGLHSESADHTNLLTVGEDESDVEMVSDMEEP